MQIARTFENQKIKNAEFEKVRRLLETRLVGCRILAPVKNAFLDNRVVIAEVFVPENVAPEFLEVNGVPLKKGRQGYLAEIVVGEGNQNLTLNYRHQNYTFEIESLPVVVDITPPVLQIKEISLDSHKGSIIISGTAFDNQKLVRLYCNEHPNQQVSADFRNWQLVFPVTEVFEQVTIIAEDVAGLKTARTCQVTKDKKAPEVTFLSPLPGSKIYSPSIVLKGKISDSSGVKEFKIGSQKVSLSDVTEDNWEIKIDLGKEQLVGDKILIPVQALDHWGNTFNYNLSLLPEYLYWQSLSPKIINAHYAKIWGMCYSPDGKYLVIAGNDGLVSIWDTKNYKNLWVRELKLEDTPFLKITPAARFISDYLSRYTGSNRQTFLPERENGGTWKVNAAILKEHHLEKLLPFFDYHITCAALSPDAKYMAMGHSSGSLKIIDLKSLKYIARVNVHKGDVLALAYSPDGKWLASGGGDRITMLWETETYRCCRRLLKHTMPVTALAFSDYILATASRDKSIWLWSLKSGQAITRLKGHKSPIEAISFHPDRTTLCSASSGGKVIVWKPRKAK